MRVELSTTTYLAVMVLALLSGMTTLIGVALAFWVGRRAKGIALGIGFSTGIMLLISVFELFPAAVGETGIVAALGALAAGVVLLAVLHWIIPHTHLFQEAGVFGQTLLRSSYLVAFGLILHDFPEGFALANGYIASASLGVMVALAVALHNIPEEFAMAVPMLAYGTRRSLLAAAVLSGLAEPLGAVAGLSAVHFHPALNPLFMAFAAGAMIFVSVHELLPMARLHGETAMFIVGVMGSVAVYILLMLLIRG